MFILSILRALKPKISIANDIVIEIGEIAEEMYFISKGFTVVIATDNTTLIASLNEGSYFGEIGILITNIRTVSIKACTICLFYTIRKDDLLKILDSYPDQMAFLMAVAKQRMLTTNPEDLIEDLDSNFNCIFDEINPLNRVPLNSNNLTINSTNAKIKCNMTRDFPKSKKFIIIPFSQFYYIWIFFVTLACIYNLFFVPFAIAFEYEFEFYNSPIDALSLLIYTLDIFFTIKTAFNNKFEITLDMNEISSDYIRSRFIFDTICIIPFDYIFTIFTADEQIISFWRLNRLIKIYKLLDYLKVWRKYYLGKRNFWYIVIMGLVFIYMAHLNACIFYFIGKYEVRNYDRFDGQCLFRDIINRNFLSLSPVLEMSLPEKYCHFMYLGACTVGGTVYGDIIPFAMSEQLYNQVTTFLSRIVVAFIYAQASGYISTIYMTYSNHIESKEMMIEYLDIHNIPMELKKRVNRYYEILWNNFKGMNDEEIMRDLPENINKEIKLHVFTSFIEKFTIFPKDDNAAITSLLTRIKISLVPKGEYIIREREIRDCVYFIIKGSVQISNEGIILATLEQGAIFGEMAIAEKIPTVRNASALCLTHVCIGSCSLEDYNTICYSYPKFENQIQKEIERRKADNLTKTPNPIPKSTTNIKQLFKETKVVRYQSAFKIQDRSIESSNLESNREILQTEKNKQNTFFNKNLAEQNNTPIKLKRKSNDAKIEAKSSRKINKKTKFSKDPIINQVNIENPNMPNIMDEAVESEEQSNSEQIQSSISNLQPKSINKAIVDKSYTKNEKKCNKRYYLDSIKRFILILLQIYNLVFIPIQGAYRVKFSPPLIILELITIVFYVVDFVLLCSKYKRIKQSLSKITNESSLNSNIILNPVEADRKQLKILKIHFILSAICCIPFAMIFSFTNIDEPTLLIYFIKCTRLLKTWPLRRLSNFCKRHYLKITRIIEMLLIYYIVIHIFACSLICIAYNAPDIRTTWLKRLPVPQPTGVRLYADKTGLSDFSIYCHAFNFSVNTLSHVATGEVSMITYQERIYCAFMILLSTFVYAFLFGNITSIVSDFASQKMYFKFYQKYENVMSSLKAESVPKRIILSIKNYFEFDWLNSHGIQIEEMSKKLPSCISTDILASRYLLCMHNCILFKDSNDKIDVPFANSFLISLKFRTYMDGDFIVIGGSHSRNTYIIMEGEAGIFSFNDDFISFMITGSHYSNDLDSDDEDTFQYKRPIHIISKGTSIVGVLTLDMLNELYLAYPNFKEKMRTSNKQFNLFAKEHLKRYLNSLNIDYNMTSAINEITKHLSYSSSSVYDHLREKLDVIDFKSTELNDMSIEVKQTERLGIIEENRELNYFDEWRDEDCEQEIKMQVNEIKKNCLSRIQFSKYSNFIKVFDVIHLINMLYIIVSIPLSVGFQIKMESSLIAIEIVSIFISLITIIINLRVQVIRRSGPTVDFKEVISYYYHNGLILDLFGLWPLNLVLGAPNLVQPFWIISALRIIRCICSIRIYSVIRKFEISFQKYGLIINILKACIFVCTIWHLISCLWCFVNIYLESDKTQNWIEYQNLSNSPLYLKILYCYFNILNTVVTIGYTNLAPVTDIERIFIAFTINSGDALFAVGFGLLAGIITQSSIYGRSEEFFRKMNSIKDLLQDRNCDQEYIKKVEHYFAFLWYSQNKSTNIMVIKDLSEQLPYRLSTEVVYHCTKELLEPMFGKFGSENLIRDLSSVLKQTIYLPGDFIILKGDIGEEMYFIAEGSVLILAADKRTVISTLSKGAYFGEMAIFLDSNKRTAYVQAETFCNILILLKQNVDRIKSNYPSVADDIKKETMKRLNEGKIIEENKEKLIRDSTSDKNVREESNNYAKTLAYEDRSFFSNEKSVNLFDQRSSEDNKSSVLEENKEELIFNKIDSNSVWIKEESKYDTQTSHSEEIQYSLKDNNYKQSMEECFVNKDCINKKRLAQSVLFNNENCKLLKNTNEKSRSCSLENLQIKELQAIKDDKHHSNECNYESSIIPTEKSLNLKNPSDSNRSNKSCNDDEIEIPIIKIVDSVDAERKLQPNNSNQNEDSLSENSREDRFRRRGVVRERRFSRINLGKQLAFYLK